MSPTAVPPSKPARLVVDGAAQAPAIRFEAGKTYATRSACDHECIFSFTILGRTEKTVTVEVHGKKVRRGLLVWDGVENFRPFGSYSMAAVISAASAGGVL